MKSPATGFDFPNTQTVLGCAAALTMHAVAEMRVEAPNRPELPACEALVALGAELATLTLAHNNDRQAAIYWASRPITSSIESTLPAWVTNAFKTRCWAVSVYSARAAQPAELMNTSTGDYYACDASFIGTATERATRCAFALGLLLVRLCTNNQLAYASVPDEVERHVQDIYAEATKAPAINNNIVAIEAHWQFVAYGGRPPDDTSELDAFTAASVTNRGLAVKIARGMLRAKR